jgi:N-acetylglucosaminyldiphosphoundecaprenol N-acetyl-beta-D-mannosaminyltransferase
MGRSVSILGIRVHDVTMAEALDWFEAAIGARTPRQLCTCNPEFVMEAQHDREFFDLLNRADLVVPDGIGLLWAARRWQRPLRERVAGSDLVERLAERAAHRGWRLFFLGAAEGVAGRAAEILRARYPGLDVVGVFAGSPRPEEEADIVARVQAAAPDVLLVAYGHPRQDKWIARNLARLRVPVSAGVGGSFDFIAGVVPRAPRWVQAVHLEWLYRLWRQPWRLRRVFKAAVLFPLAVLRRRRSGP